MVADSVAEDDIMKNALVVAKEQTLAGPPTPKDAVPNSAASTAPNFRASASTSAATSGTNFRQHYVLDRPSTDVPRTSAFSAQDVRGKRQASVIEMLEYVKALDIDPVREGDLLWIAEDAFSAPLPPNWAEHLDDAGRVYYHNVVTGESAWVHPMDETFRSIAQYQRDVMQVGGFWYLDDMLNKEEDVIREHLREWMELFDEHGEKFFYNKKSEESTFSDPRVVAYHDLYYKIKEVSKMKDKFPMLARAPRPMSTEEIVTEAEEARQGEEAKYLRAVCKIQSYGRMMYAKKKVKFLRERKIPKGMNGLRLSVRDDGTGQKDLVLSMTTDKRRDKAACKIQAFLRGRSARKRVFPMMEHRRYQSNLLIPIQTRARVWLAKRRVAFVRLKRKEASVLRIQRIYRGHCGRMRVKELLRQRAQYAHMVDCVIAVQCAMRSALAWRQVKKMRLAHHTRSMLRIQSVMRAFIDRNTLMRISLMKNPISAQLEFREEDPMRPWSISSHMAPLNREGVWLSPPHSVKPLFSGSKDIWGEYFEEAVRMIQKCARGFLSRLSGRRRRYVASEAWKFIEQRAMDRIVARCQGAAKLQSRAKGHLVRKSDVLRDKFLGRFSAGSAGNIKLRVLQSSIRTYLEQKHALKRVRDEELRDASTRIQRVWRGRLGRRHVQMLVEETEWPLKGWFDYTVTGGSSASCVRCNVQFLPNVSFDDYRYFVQYGDASDLKCSLEDMELEVALCVDQYLHEFGLTPSSPTYKLAPEDEVEEDCPHGFPSEITESSWSGALAADASSAVGPSVAVDRPSAAVVAPDLSAAPACSSQGKATSGPPVDSLVLPSAVEPATMDPSPVEPSPVDPSPVEPSRVDPSPVEPSRVDPSPVEPAAMDTIPVEPGPVDPSPVEPTLVDPSPVEPTPVAPTPVVPTLVDPSPVEPTPVDPRPVEVGLGEPRPQVSAESVVEGAPDRSSVNEGDGMPDAVEIAEDDGSDASLEGPLVEEPVAEVTAVEEACAPSTDTAPAAGIVLVCAALAVNSSTDADASSAEPAPREKDAETTPRQDGEPAAESASSDAQALDDAPVHRASSSNSPPPQSPSQPPRSIPGTPDERPSQLDPRILPGTPDGMPSTPESRGPNTPDERYQLDHRIVPGTPEERPSHPHPRDIHGSPEQQIVELECFSDMPLSPTEKVRARDVSSTRSIVSQPQPAPIQQGRHSYRSAPRGSQPAKQKVRSAPKARTAKPKQISQSQPHLTKDFFHAAEQIFMEEACGKAVASKASGKAVASPEGDSRSKPDDLPPVRPPSRKGSAKEEPPSSPTSAPVPYAGKVVNGKFVKKRIASVGNFSMEETAQLLKDMEKDRENKAKLLAERQQRHLEQKKEREAREKKQLLSNRAKYEETVKEREDKKVSTVKDWIVRKEAEEKAKKAAEKKILDDILEKKRQRKLKEEQWERERQAMREKNMLAMEKKKQKLEMQVAHAQEPIEEREVRKQVHHHVHYHHRNDEVEDKCGMVIAEREALEKQSEESVQKSLEGADVSHMHYHMKPRRSQNREFLR